MLNAAAVAALMLAGSALAGPEIVKVHHCMPTDPAAGDYRLQGGILDLETDTNPDQPTPAAVGAAVWLNGLGWVTRDEAALLMGEDLTNRVDIVFVGDGYTAPELALYAQQVDQFANAMFAEEPLATYRPLFAVHRVDVVSNDSGVDNDPVQGISRDTAMDMSYWCGGTERALCVNVGLAHAYANTAILPGGESPDQVIAVANSSKYGGVGYPSNNLGTAAAGNDAAVEIVVHELGHSMADLADEYTYGGPVNYTGPEPGAANASRLTAAQMTAQNRKWTNWVGTSVASWDGLHSTFEGAVYSETGVFRPTNNSKMRSLYRPFNLVSAEAFIKEIYREVDPVDSFGPTQFVDQHMELWVTPVRPAGRPLDIQWYYNGEPIPGAVGESLDTLAAGVTGTGLISVVVRDNTAWLRDEAYRDANMTQTVLFATSNLPAACRGDIADDLGMPGGDGVVGFGDFLALLGLVGPCPGGLPGCSGDFADDFGTLSGGDGQVSFGDFLALLGLVGPCP